jgi:hypothetical protein
MLEALFSFVFEVVLLDVTAGVRGADPAKALE